MAWVVKNEIKNDHRCPTTSIWWWVEFVIFKKLKIMCCAHLFGDGNFISHNTIKIIKQGLIPIDGGEETTKAPQKGKPCIFDFSPKSQYHINHNYILDFLIL
jgi:hypothetical protein